MAAAPSDESQAVSVLVQTMSGEVVELPRISSMASVRELAVMVRSKLGIPISAQNLVWESEVLSDPSQRLQCIFGDVGGVNLSVVRRPFTIAERAEMYKRLVRAVVAGAVAEFRELLKEGVQPNFRREGSGLEVPVSLSHWEDFAEAADAACPTDSITSIVDAPNAKKKKQRTEMADPEDGNGTDERLTMEPGAEMSESDDEPSDVQEMCGGLTPLLMALAAGEEGLAEDLRSLGAEEPEMTPKLGLADAFEQRNFPEIAKCIASGADLNMCLGRQHGVSATSHGVPLHACVAMRKMPGAFEIAHLLIRKKADLTAGDAEGDNPLAHAKYFDAKDMLNLLQGNGAVIQGPFYTRFGRE